MSDATHRRLYEIAESQAGYFTTNQAVQAGMDRTTLYHHVRPSGRYRRVQHGLYRLNQFPPSPLEHIVAAWLPLHSRGAVVSHESALEIYGLTDVIPDVVHVSLPRAQRGGRRRGGVRIHTVSRPFKTHEILTRGGVVVTSPERSIVDTAAAGGQLDQIAFATWQALDRGITSRKRIGDAALGRIPRVRRDIADALAGAGS